MKIISQCSFSGHGGFVLPMAIGMFLCATIAFGGVLSYVAYSTRYVKNEHGKAHCLAAAQSAIEIFKGEVNSKFAKYKGDQGQKVTIAKFNASAYDRWFETLTGSGPVVSVGISPNDARHPGVEFDAKNGCTVYMSARKTGPAQLMFVATGADGHGNAVTVSETFDYGGAEVSKVFNHAYFVNNYGWMTGDTITINGDMRANGDMSIAGSVVNGTIYAAPNAEVNADGEVKISSYNGKLPVVLSRDNYWNNFGNYGKRARPTSPTSSTSDKNWNGGFAAPKNSDVSLSSRSVTDPTNAGHAYIREEETGLAMPYISDLSDYKRLAQEAQNNGGASVSATLKYCPYNFANGTLDTDNPKTISICNYTQDDNLETSWDNEMVASAEVGPSGVAGAGDQGAVVLVGTRDHPIELSGPVVIASDVVIMGYIKGQGAIYSGRNIHIVGDLTYVNPPTWEKNDTTPETTRDANQNKDLVTLMAKGCIVTGNQTSYEWKNTVEKYINNSGSDSVTKRYYCDDNDSSIGYPRSNKLFSGNYAAEINDSSQGVGTDSKVRKYYDSAYAVPVIVKRTYDGNGNLTLTETPTRSTSSFNKAKYGVQSTPELKQIDSPYSAVGRNLNNEVVSTVDVSNQVVTKDNRGNVTKVVRDEKYYVVIGNTRDPNYNDIKSKTYSDKYKNKNIRYYDSVVSDALIDQLASRGYLLAYGDNRGSGIANIDAVMYDNHGTFGQLGQGSKDICINGSLICRDEGLIFSGGKLTFNWDIRLKTDGAEGLKDAQWYLASESVVQTRRWHIVPSTTEWNPNYNAEGGL